MRIKNVSTGTLAVDSNSLLVKIRQNYPIMFILDEDEQITLIESFFNNSIEIQRAIAEGKAIEIVPATPIPGFKILKSLVNNLVISGLWLTFREEKRKIPNIILPKDHTIDIPDYLLDLNDQLKYALNQGLIEEV